MVLFLYKKKKIKNKNTILKTIGYSNTFYLVSYRKINEKVSKNICKCYRDDDSRAK